MSHHDGMEELNWNTSELLRRKLDELLWLSQKSLFVSKSCNSLLLDPPNLHCCTKHSYPVWKEETEL